MSTTPISYSVDSSTLTLNGHVITDVIAGDAFVLAPVNALTSRVNGANDSVSVSKRIDANVYTLTVNVLKNSEDDVWFSEQINQPYPVIFEGSLKENYKFGDEIRVSTWALGGGSITTLPTDTRNNQDNNVTMAYVIEFRSAVQGK